MTQAAIALTQRVTDSFRGLSFGLIATPSYMDYRQFTAIDLAADPGFIDWVQRPDAINTAFWETFLAQHPHRAGEVDAARQFVTGWQINPQIRPDECMREIWLKIDAEKEGPSQSFVVHRSWRNYRQWAAVLVGILMLAMATRWLINNMEPGHYATGKGETKKVQLPDGSTVVLAANSSIDVLGDWQSEQARELALQGEAFFSVVHRPDHQTFRVKTPDNLRVEVLGTTFTVSERATKTQVVLNSGKVALYINQVARPVFMKPGELVDVLKTRQRNIVRRTVNPTVYSAWTDNQFVFENTSLGEIAAMIEADSGDTVQFSDESLKDRRVTLRLPNRDLDLLLTSLAEIHDLAIDRKPNRIVIAENPSTK